MFDKRKYPRIVRVFMSWFKFMHSDTVPPLPKEWDIVTARDLGAGGMLFNYDKPIPVGTQIQLKIVFPFTKGPITCIGTVIRNEKVVSTKYPALYHIAAQFSSIGEDNKMVIDKVAKEVYSAKCHLSSV
ncbi:MAG: PilZ domain-containing protein [Candidatus Omnitrophota bacterium]|jgi:hypothetical protein